MSRDKSALKMATLAVMLSTAVPCAPPVDQLTRYCEASWRNAHISRHDWEDCTQETFAELLNSIPEAGWTVAASQPESDERRELNRSIWRVSQRWRRQKRYIPLDENIGVPGISDPLPQESRPQVASAISELPEPQKNVLTLWMNGSGVSEIAGQLKLSAARVSDLKYKALQQLKTQIQNEA